MPGAADLIKRPPFIIRQMGSIPCIVVAGTHSGVGKTSVATALMSAYTRRGLRVQGFKVGPDFIDPSFHTLTTGRPSHNLDGWMLSREANIDLFTSASCDADLCIVEGVMGLFDGRSADGEDGSTAQMAKWLGAPVLLVVDGAAMARSGAAVVYGFESFDRDVRFAGVLFNRVSGERHYAYLRDSVRARCQTLPLGHLPSNAAVTMPERHLGLHLAGEVITPDLLGTLANWLEQSLDLDALLKQATLCPTACEIVGRAVTLPVSRVVRVAVARDSAFQFYYEANLQLLRDSGADVVFFSPIHDCELPTEIGAVYLGGGYPELHASQLSANRSMLESVREFAASGGLIYAECGGFMYLTEAIVDHNGLEHPLCGIFPTRARMRRKLAALGYAELEVASSFAWLEQGMTMRSHEFRYSEIDTMPTNIERLYNVQRAYGPGERNGYIKGNILGSYFHVHFGSCPGFAPAFVRAASTASLVVPGSRL